jgi:hypothetical protein
LKPVGSNESIESLAGGDDELKKKIMQGFDELKDPTETICKRLSKSFKIESDDD